MNIEFSIKYTPPGTRFLYRDSYGFLKEGIIYEWSKSGTYINISGEWMMLDSVKNILIVEILDTNY